VIRGDVNDTALEPSALATSDNPSVCRVCEEPLTATTDHGLCGGCEDLLPVEIARLLEGLGSLAAIGTVSQVDDAKQSLSVLYASTILGTNADRIARFLGLSRTTTRQYGMRFRAAMIWTNGEAKGPWSSKPWLSPAFCRLFLMDALVGAGLAIRGKDRWDFLDEGPKKAA
jgi:hypothetical protein